MKIAVLDDDERIRTTVSLLLEALDHTPRAFATEDELFVGLETFAPEMVIVDQMLGAKRTGIQLVQDLRDKYSALPIVIISGYPQMELDKAVELNHVSFLAKPFSLAALEKRISEYSND